MVAVLAFAVVVWLGVVYRDDTRRGPFDRRVDGWLMGHVNHRTALWFADLGNPPVVVIVTAVAVALFWLTRYRRGALLSALAPTCSSVLSEYVLKPLVHRTKSGYLAYPSGHAAGWCAIAFAVVLVLAAPSYRRLPRRASTGVVALVLLLTAASMLGLVASNYHYSTDVIGGICLALGCVLAVALVLDALAAVLVRRGPYGQ